MADSLDSRVQMWEAAAQAIESSLNALLTDMRTTILELAERVAAQDEVIERFKRAADKAAARERTH